MLELGSSGSARGVSSNGHPYRDPRWEAVTRSAGMNDPGVPNSRHSDPCPMSISVDPLFVTRSRARGKRSITDITRKNIVRRCAVQMPQTLNHRVLFRHRPAPTRDFGGLISTITAQRAAPEVVTTSPAAH